MRSSGPRRAGRLLCCRGASVPSLRLADLRIAAPEDESPVTDGSAAASGAGAWLYARVSVAVVEGTRRDPIGVVLPPIHEGPDHL